METVEAFKENITTIIESVRHVLEQTPPELSSDIMDKGVVLTGGGSLLHGLDTLISKETQIPVFSAESPLSCVAEGTGIALEELENLKDILTSSDML